MTSDEVFNKVSVKVLEAIHFSDCAYELNFLITNVYFYLENDTYLIDVFYSLIQLMNKNQYQ